ncbi:serine/arginine repetitive matrix protein 2-like [Moschus berezovskii]|uniref:serine/arginine repetitive matrix protein 2-like n=1 Tax=Moschus berezovskii TaxID=68408 RepID=UPI0024438020|nr:serine/arginine repetitive matrix protein 2-like [Moschus berezovskii]
MDAEKEAAARPTRGSQRLEGRRTRTRERKSREKGEGRRDQAGAGERGGRGARRSQPSRKGPRPWDLRFSRPGGRFPATTTTTTFPLTRPSARETAREPSPAAVRRGSPRTEAADQRPGESRAALAPVGTSTRRGRGLASITADLPRPPCWEETTRHAAAERLQRRKRRRRRRWLPRAAAAPGGRGRRAAREERLEPQRYGGLAGPRRLPRSPAGRRGAWRASCGAALDASGSDDPRRRRGRRADAAPGSAAGASPTFQSLGI